MKNIHIDNNTKEVTTLCGRIEFIKQMSKLLGMYWPDWSGLFHVAYPSVTSSESQTDQYITVRTMLEEPMAVDTVFGRGGAPSTKTPSKGLTMPKLLDTKTDDSKDDLVEVWSQSYDCIMEFEFFTKTTMEAHELAEKFKHFMRNTRHIYIRENLKNLVFIKYSEDKDQELKFNESYRQSYMRYFLQYEDFWFVRIPRLQAVTISTVKSEFPAMMAMPASMLPNQIKNTVTTSYSVKSQKIP